MTERFKPSYLALHASGELDRRAAGAREKLSACDLCGNLCRVDRLTERDAAICRTGSDAIVYSAAPHHGEERVISGRCGSGTIFFSRCNLSCVFCQNAEISQGDLAGGADGRTMTAPELADLMLHLQATGCHNINLVSASHVVAQTIEALVIAAGAGLQLPIVYNSGGYDSPAALGLLDGVIDIYMPDMKCADDEVAGRYLGASNYPEVNRAAVKEMHRQVGDLELDGQGVARRGLLVRHLVMPHDLAGTGQVVDFLAAEISVDTAVNIMGQYRPCYRANSFPDINRRPTTAEIDHALGLASRAGLHRVYGP